MNPTEVASRRDLRDNHLVFSIDPLGCEDVDDTLSVRSLADGTLLELGVHIADVSHFVAEGSLTDLEARSRWESSHQILLFYRMTFYDRQKVSFYSKNGKQNCLRRSKKQLPPCKTLCRNHSIIRVFSERFCASDFLRA